MKYYLRENPRFVEALCKVLISPDFNFNLLRQKAIEEDVGNTVNWLLQEYILAFRKEGLYDKARTLEKALPLFSNFNRSLDEVLASESNYRRLKVVELASPIAKKCGVPVVYDQDSLRKRVRLYCGN